jgi:hypothetical protein
MLIEMRKPVIFQRLSIRAVVDVDLHGYQRNGGVMHDNDVETIAQCLLVYLVLLRECCGSPENQESGSESDYGSAVHCVLL